MPHCTNPLEMPAFSDGNISACLRTFLVEILSSMTTDLHPMLRWAEAHEMALSAVAKAVECSESHLRNIFAGRKEASLGLAKKLSDLSGGTVPMDAFLRAEAAP